MRTVIVTMVFSNKTVFAAGMDRLYRTVAQPFRHVVYDAFYPLDPPDVAAFVAGAGELVTEMTSGKNLGLHGNANHILAKLDPELADEDVVIFYDADEGPTQPGWLAAMEAVFESDPACGWLSLTAPPIIDAFDFNKVAITSIAGVRLRVPPFCMMNLVCGWRVGALRRIGPLTEPHAWYGGLEVDAQPKFRAAGYWVGWLEDFKTQPFTVLHDETYTRYKRHHGGHSKPVFPGSFEEWIASENR